MLSAFARSARTQSRAVSPLLRLASSSAAGVPLPSVVTPSLAAGLPQISSASVSTDGNSIVIHSDSDEATNLHKFWILDNSAEVRDPETTQKIRYADELSSDISALSVKLAPSEATSTATAASSVVVEWSDGTASTLDAAWLAAHCFSFRGEQQYDPLQKFLTTSDPVPAIDFETVKNSEEGVYAWTAGLLDFGLCVLTDGPTETGHIVPVAERICSVMPTLYGNSFHVRSEEKPINIAYTNVKLRPHMDLAYYESPPGIQMLHCVRFDDTVSGGESTFYDTFMLAELLRSENPAAFEVLARVPATFQKDHMERSSPAQMFYRRPHIGLNAQGRVTSVFWSPAFEGPLRVDNLEARALGFDDELDAQKQYYDAYRSFAHLLADPAVAHEYLIKFRCSPGTVLAFNQRRMLHGREAFSGEGVRHFEGTYLNIDDFLSRHRSLAVQFGAAVRGIDAAPRASNGCAR